mgnify:CR=1 FL=1
METRKVVVPIQVDYQCDKCEEGVMRPTGVVKPMSPPLIVHRCTKCGHEDTYRNKRYPYIVYEEIKQDETNTRDKEEN